MPVFRLKLFGNCLEKDKDYNNQNFSQKANFISVRMKKPVGDFTFDRQNRNDTKF